MLTLLNYPNKNCENPTARSFSLNGSSSAEAVDPAVVVVAAVLCLLVIHSVK